MTERTDSERGALVHTGTAIGWYRCDGKGCPICGPNPPSGEAETPKSKYISVDLHEYQDEAQPASPDARREHQWGCPSFSSGDDSECDCGASSIAMDKGETAQAGVPLTQPTPDALTLARQLMDKLFKEHY